MLQLTGIAEAKKETIKFDFYVPINIEFEPWEEKQEHHLYWRSGKYIEIGINPTSKAISSITLLFVTKIYSKKKQNSLLSNKRQIGLPLFKTNKWHETTYFLDEATNRNFEIYIEKDRAIIILALHRIESKIINNRVIFGFDKNNFLCTIEVIDLSISEKTILEESLKAKSAYK